MKKHDLPYSPKGRAFILKNLADFQTELFRVIAGHLPGLTLFEARKRIARFIFEDARRVQDLRARCRELALILPEIFLSRSLAGAEIINMLAKVSDANLAVAAAYLIIKRSLRNLLKSHTIPDLEVFDSPSIAPIEENIRTLDEQIGWVERIYANRLDENGSLLGEISLRCESLGKELAREPLNVMEQVREGRKIGVLPILRSVLPEGFKDLPEGMNMNCDGSYASRSASAALNFLQELQAGDSCASLLFEAPDMPWEFYLDTARHMWDEMRHCEFGEIKLRQLKINFMEAGLSNVAYTMRQTLGPLDRYAALTTQEADAFPGKHAGLKEALENDDVLAATAWSYDISDETQHVRFGQRWIPVMIEQVREPRSYSQIKTDAENWRSNVLASKYLPAAASV